MALSRDPLRGVDEEEEGVAVVVGRERAVVCRVRRVSSRVWLLLG
jgi:hypothetical protein